MRKIKLKNYKVSNRVYDTENFLSEPWQYIHPDYMMEGDYLVKLLHKNGYECDLKTAIELWERHSNSMDGSWLYLYKKDEYNLDAVMEFIE